MKNELHIKEMVDIFRQDFNDHTESEVHLNQLEHDNALHEYIIKRICDNWEIDRNYSDQQQEVINELQYEAQTNTKIR